MYRLLVLNWSAMVDYGGPFRFHSEHDSFAEAIRMMRLLCAQGGLYRGVLVFRSGSRTAKRYRRFN